MSYSGISEISYTEKYIISRRNDKDIITKMQIIITGNPTKKIENAGGEGIEYTYDDNSSTHTITIKTDDEEIKDIDNVEISENVDELANKILDGMKSNVLPRMYKDSHNIEHALI